MSTTWPSLSLAPATVLPAAHLAGWLWTAYLVPVLIVVVPLVKNQLDSRKKQRPKIATTRKRRR